MSPASEPERTCPPPVVTAATPKPDSPVRKLVDEPPAALIATVDTKVDGCPMMLVLDSGETGRPRGWTPVPNGVVRSVR